MLPWALVRLIVATMGRLQALKSMRYFRPLVAPGQHNPLLEIQVARVRRVETHCRGCAPHSAPWPCPRRTSWLASPHHVGVSALLTQARLRRGKQVVPVLSKDECAALIADAEDYAARWGWTTSRHQTHATTDIPVQLLPQGGRLWNETIAPRVQQAIAAGFGFRPESVTPVDVFLVKYQSEDGGQRELSVHRDGALMTFSLLLNDPADFAGGGTYFEESGRVYRPAQGVAVMHSGKLRHGGFPITRGTRYVLVGFCLVEHESVSAELKHWRWGEPDWYLRCASLATPLGLRSRMVLRVPCVLYVCAPARGLACAFLRTVALHSFVRACVRLTVCLSVHVCVSALEWFGTRRCWTAYTIQTASGERERLRGLKPHTRRT